MRIGGWTFGITGTAATPAASPTPSRGTVDTDLFQRGSWATPITVSSVNAAGGLNAGTLAQLSNGGAALSVQSGAAARGATPVPEPASPAAQDEKMRAAVEAEYGEAGVRDWNDLPPSARVDRYAMAMVDLLQHADPPSELELRAAAGRTQDPRVDRFLGFGASEAFKNGTPETRALMSREALLRSLQESRGSMGSWVNLAQARFGDPKPEEVAAAKTRWEGIFDSVARAEPNADFQSLSASISDRVKLVVAGLDLQPSAEGTAVGPSADSWAATMDAAVEQKPAKPLFSERPSPERTRRSYESLLRDLPEADRQALKGWASAHDYEGWLVDRPEWESVLGADFAHLPAEHQRTWVDVGRATLDRVGGLRSFEKLDPQQREDALRKEAFYRAASRTEDWEGLSVTDRADRLFQLDVAAQANAVLALLPAAKAR